MITPNSRPDLSAHLLALRQALIQSDLVGFLVPRADEHQGEYIPPSSKRLAWLTGYSGSFGMAVVLREEAAIFVDGRYTLQVRSEVDTARFQPFNVADLQPPAWLQTKLKPGDRIGYDPWLHTPDELGRFDQALSKVGAKLEPLAANPIDALWSDRPAPPRAAIRPHDLRFAGETSADKLKRVAASLAGEGVDAFVVSQPDSIAWLLNVRGGDVANTPLPLSFAVLRAGGDLAWCVDPAKLSPELLAHLDPAVRPLERDALAGELDRLGAEKRRVGIDFAASPAWIQQRLEKAGALARRMNDPCQAPKARKNPVELAGTRAAHRRDGAALSRFLAWLAREAPTGRIDELGAADRLHAFRAEDNLFREPSFTTISGAGPNGAIVHYRSSPATNRRLEPGQLYLVDSGGQYLDGTTDVTRTVAIGAPSAEMRDRFTRVLKGHIALATCRFPKGTSGSQLDALARLALWQAGLDYDHGTGHGVGSYLGVHEGPQRISKLPNTVALEPGMIVSNEPGYYKTDAYGIRIENLVTVVEDKRPGDERPMLGFDTLTRAPIDRALIDRGLLTADEVAWVDRFHAQVREEIAPLLAGDAAARAWLEMATRPLD
ncbi:MAG: aminopeptidase P family protein [Alphaproteobacteria bacterium]|nr:aminopeptidase P family protein [Alphaproteobacteria bacterium]